MVLRLVLVLLGLMLPATLAAVTPPDPAPRTKGFLTGQLLVASPAMGDPRFAQTVLVMVRHNREGAMALIVNRPLGDKPMARLMEAIGEKPDGATGTVRIHYGGPVQPQLGFVLHGTDYRDAATIDIDGRVAVSASRDVFRAIAAGGGPQQSIVAFGYAGWAPGQLEGELALNAWFVAPMDLQLVFEEDRDKVWELAVTRRTREL